MSKPDSAAVVEASPFKVHFVVLDNQYPFGPWEGAVVGWDGERLSWDGGEVAMPADDVGDLIRSDVLSVLGEDDLARWKETGSLAPVRREVREVAEEILGRRVTFAVGQRERVIPSR
jgi:hypothetical protein